MVEWPSTNSPIYQKEINSVFYFLAQTVLIIGQSSTNVQKRFTNEVTIVQFHSQKCTVSLSLPFPSSSLLYKQYPGKGHRQSLRKKTLVRHKRHLVKHKGHLAEHKVTPGRFHTPPYRLGTLVIFFSWDPKVIYTFRNLSGTSRNPSGTL